METVYRDIISGRSQSWAAKFCRLLLQLAVCPYALAVAIRNFAYSHRWRTVVSVRVPVISIGNLTTGGTGKTPTVAWLARLLSQSGSSPAIVSRGYRSLDGQENDEKRLLDRLCPEIPHLQNRDRPEAAQHAIDTCGANVIVLDDGFQHRRLHRDLDLVLIDALNPWGYGHLLPRGLLREPLKSLHRADAVLITRCDLAEAENVQQIQHTLSRHTTAPVYRTAFRPTGFLNAWGERLPLESAHGRKAAAFCAIGNPQGFHQALAAVGIPVSADRFLTFPDHHHYTHVDIQRIATLAEDQGAELLITTAKDLVKLTKTKLGPAALWALEIELAFLDDPAPLEARILSVLRR